MLQIDRTRATQVYLIRYVTWYFFETKKAQTTSQQSCIFFNYIQHEFQFWLFSFYTFVIGLLQTPHVVSVDLGRMRLQWEDHAHDVRYGQQYGTSIHQWFDVKIVQGHVSIQTTLQNKR